VSLERARREPSMDTLSALAHGNRPDGKPVTLAALTALKGLRDDRAILFVDLIFLSLNEAARRVLENEMQHGEYEFKSDFARRYFGAGRKQGHREGRHEGQLEAARTLLLRLAKDRFGLAGDRVRRPIEACGDLARLTALFSQINAAPDRKTAERLVAELESKPARPARLRARRAHTARTPRAPRAPGARAARR
jgi:hypothetical protein